MFSIARDEAVRLVSLIPPVRIAGAASPTAHGSSTWSAEAIAGISRARGITIRPSPRWSGGSSEAVRPRPVNTIARFAR